MKFFCPLPRRFAVMQMDPVEMVKHYNDPVAVGEAQAMKPKKYLVYLRNLLELPTPSKPWFRYDIRPIGTTLRPEDKDSGITADMVVPIYPNTVHPNGRPAIPTETPFPFSNCYFWIDTRLVVRIRRKAHRYDDTGAPMLSIYEDMDLERHFMGDHMRIAASQRDNLGDAASLEMPHGDGYDNASSFHASTRAFQSDVASTPDHDVDSLMDGNDLHKSSGSGDAPSTPPSDDLHDIPFNPEIAEILQMDFLSTNIDHTIEFIPLVDLWFDVATQITPETIANPMDFYMEQEEIARIIRDARERATTICWPPKDPGVPIDYDAISLDDTSDADVWQDHIHDHQASSEGSTGRRYGRAIGECTLLAGFAAF
ncbi:hypothetical protein C8Q77DRAFT_1140655 [Trametes polyzona]|nr:hypothetical protein C8Q77DRAFT_1140655 [Trametes polyzona]